MTQLAVNKSLRKSVNDVGDCADYWEENHSQGKGECVAVWFGQEFLNLGKLGPWEVDDNIIRRSNPNIVYKLTGETRIGPDGYLQHLGVWPD